MNTGHFLNDVIGIDHPMLVKTIADLERASGNAGIDTKLIADMTERAHALMRELRIDPADTSGKELYLALNASVGNDSVMLRLAESPYVLMRFDDGPVSFNLQDVIDNAHHELPYETRTTAHAQRHLRIEVIKRYAASDRIHDSLLHELTQPVGLKREEDHSYPLLAMGEVAHGNARMLAIGDIFTDAFIKLNEGSAKIIHEGDTQWLALPFGQKPPYDQVDIIRSVGPSPNAAVSMSRLGLNASLMAWVGSDDVGKEAINHLESEHVDTESMVTEQGKATSYWYVLRYGADRTMLVKSEQYTYEWKDSGVTPDWVYLSYIGQDSWPLHERLVAYLDVHPETKLAFQPGTFHFKWGVEKLRDIYAHSHIVVMNREEAVDVTGKSYDSLKDLTDGLHELGPSIVVITDGPNGSYASYDGKIVTIPNYPDPADPLDRTGAGDAFASTIVSALAMGETMDVALTWAPINSMNVVQKLGAQAGLLTKAEIEAFLRDAPESYKLTAVE